METLASRCVCELDDSPLDMEDKVIDSTFSGDVDWDAVDIEALQ